MLPCTPTMRADDKMSMPPKLKDALSDIRTGLGLWRVWMALAHEDIGDQHRRTTLGPIWLLITYLSFACTFIFLFDRGHGATNYPAHVATGLLVWFFIMETLTQSATLFTREESFIKGTRLPFSVYVMRLMVRSTIRDGYALVGCLAILFVSGTTFSFAWGWSALGLLLILLTAPAAIIIIAFLGAFIPDSQFVVANSMRLGMFLTPIFWMHDGASGVRAFFYDWNPFTYFIEIVRIPVITGQMPWQAFTLCLVMCLVLWVVALTVFALLRRDLVRVL